MVSRAHPPAQENIAAAGPVPAYGNERLQALQSIRAGFVEDLGKLKQALDIQGEFDKAKILLRERKGASLNTVHYCKEGKPTLTTE